MAWAKIDDQFPDHPKIVAAGPMAGWLHLCGICYCARQLTDGFIPARVVKRLADVPDVDALVDALVTNRLWGVSDGGYVIHDYLEYNPTAAKTKAQRQQTAERQARWKAGKEKLTPGDNNDVTNASTPTPLLTVPRPVPSPINSIDKSIETASKKTTSKGVDLAPIFDAFTNASMPKPIIPKAQQRAAGELLSQIGGPMVAEYWQDVGCGRWPTDSTTWLRNNRTFQALLDRVNNWQDWVCAGRPAVTSTPANGRAPAEVREPALFIAPGRAL